MRTTTTVRPRLRFDPSPSTHRAGELAYFDSIAGGLIPCKVTAIGSDGRAYVTLSASRGPYVRGEHLTMALSVLVPRCKVRRAHGQLKISTTYRWEAS